MTEPESSLYGPELLPKQVGGEYDIDAIEDYIIASFEDILKPGIEGADELTKWRFNRRGEITLDYVIKHVAGEMHYEVTKKVKPDLGSTEYSVIPKPHQDETNDFFINLPDTGEGYLRVVVGFTKDEFAVVAQVLGENGGIVNNLVTDPEEIVAIGNIINLLELDTTRR